MVYASGHSVSSTESYGPPLATHDQDSPTNKQEREVADTTLLKINADHRRPFFEDQYSFVKGMFDTSAYNLAKYLGSGTLGPDETKTYEGTGQGQALWNPNANTSGQLQSRSLSWIEDTSGWIPAFEKAAYGDVRYDLDDNTIVWAAGTFGYQIDRMLYTGSAHVNHADALIVVNDGVGFGQQNYGDNQVLEGMGRWIDEVGTWDAITSSVLYGYALSSLEFHPPLPKTYFNPILDVATISYANEKGVADADNYMPEHFFAKPHVGSEIIYAKRTLNGNSLELENAVIPSDWGGELKGGDHMSGTTNLSAYWDQYEGPIDPRGFEETVANAPERGYIPGLCPLLPQYLKYKKAQLNYGGEPGVHRHVHAEWTNHKFDYQNYLGSEGRLRTTKESIGVDASNNVINVIGNYQQQNWVLAWAQAHSAGMGGFVDGRMDRMYLYSPETEDLLDYNSVSATSATIDGVKYDLEDRDTLTELGVDAIYFSAYPEYPNPVGLSRQGMILNYIEPTNWASPLNSISLDLICGFGAFPDTKKMQLVRTIKYGVNNDSDFIPSNKIMAIHERTADNVGGLAPMAIGHYCTLHPDKNGSILTNAWLAPNSVHMALRNGTTSGAAGSNEFGNASHYYYTSGAWGDDETGDKLIDGNALGGSVAFLPNNCAYVPDGWVAKHMLQIVGNNKEEVIAKLHEFLSKNTWDTFISPESELPDILLKYDAPLKSGKVF